MANVQLDVAPTRADFSQIYNDDVFQSAAGAIQVAGRTGNRWGLRLTYQNVSGANGQLVRRWGARLAGRRHRLVVDVATDLNYPRTGAGGGGSITVDGAFSAGATEIDVTASAGTSITDWLKGGDMVEINSELKMLRSTTSLVTGSGTISIWPEMHKDLSGGEGIDIDTPEGIFYMTNAPSFGGGPWKADDWLSETVVLELVEDVTQ